MILEVDGKFWVPEDDPGVTDIMDPFSGLDEANLPRLLRDYDTWALDMHIQTQLHEGKAIGTSKAATGTRDNIFQSRLKSTPNYQKHMRTQRSQGTKTYERLEREAREDLMQRLRWFRDGKVDFAELRRDTADYFEHFYTKAWEAGRKASGLDLFVPESKPTKGERSWLLSAIREELKFWQSFLLEVQSGEAQFRDQFSSGTLALNPPRRKYTIEERLAMYLKGLEGIFENGRVSGMPSNLLFYWQGPKPGERGICVGCTYIVERQPYTKDTLPAVPRTGATPCLMNCRHKVVVRKATPKQIQQRRAALPERASMARVLQGMMESKWKHKVKGKLINPWTR